MRFTLLCQLDFKSFSRKSSVGLARGMDSCSGNNFSWNLSLGLNELNELNDNQVKLRTKQNHKIAFGLDLFIVSCGIVDKFVMIYFHAVKPLFF